MPPVNDTFASAVTLSGASGDTSATVYTNAAATTQVGEPGHYNFNPGPAYPVSRVLVGPYATVWFKWVCPTAGDYYFTTRDLTGAMRTSFASTLQVFTGGAVNSLTRVTLLMDQSVGDGNGMDNGASVAFTAVNGTTYYFQVDGRGSGVTGNIFIKWGAYVFNRLGQCSGCALDFVAEDCLAALQVTDVTTDAIYSFGTFAAAPGKFRVVYCGGVFMDAAGLYSNFSGWIYEGAVTIWDPTLVYNAGDQVLSGNPAYNTASTHNGLFVATGTTTCYHPTVFTSQWTYGGMVDGVTGPPYWLDVSWPFNESRVFSPSLGWTNNYGLLSAPTTTLPFRTDYSLIGGGGGSGGGSAYGFTGPFYRLTGTVPAYQPGFGGPWNSAGVTLGAAGYSSKAAAESAQRCATAIINHASSGDIGIAFATPRVSNFYHFAAVSTRDSQYANTADNPKFRLTYIPLTIAMLNGSQGAVLIPKNGSTIDNNWKISFKITNTTSTDWDNCKIELLATGGITSPSAALTGFDLTPGATVTTSQFTMVADPTAGLVTATIRITRNNVVVGTIDYPLYPVIVAALSGGVVSGGTCSGALKKQVVTYQNLNPTSLGWFGYLTSYGTAINSELTMTFGFTGGVPNLTNNTTCAATATQSVTQSISAFGTALKTFNAYTQASATTPGVTYDFNVTIGWKVSPSVTLALPAAVFHIPY